MNTQDGTGQYIWLRYATQYSKDGRTHTIEMGVPVPLGASAETREKLLREAETGMSDLVQHVEERVFQALERVQSSHTTGSQGGAVSPTSQPSPVIKVEPTTSLPVTPSTARTTPAVPGQPTPIQTRPANRPASVSAPQTTQAPNVQRTPSRTTPPPAQVVEVPPTRHSVGASMPSSLGPSSTSGNLTIPDFLSHIKESLHLSPKQAMDLLRVKSLSGINLREALENLKRIVAQNAQGETSIPQPPQRLGQQVSLVSEGRPSVSTPMSHNAPSVPPPTQPSQPTAIQPPQEAAKDELPTRPVGDALEDPEEKPVSNVTETRIPPPTEPTRGFDEEVDGSEELEDLDESDNFRVASEISPERLSRARDRISSLRETQGAAVASPARLRVLRNAADDEVSTEQLQELVAGVWHIQALSKLKMDQVEALISWAKQDDFLDEVEAVLIVLEEERYARGNR
jgi:hypothetical protein